MKLICKHFIWLWFRGYKRWLEPQGPHDEWKLYVHTGNPEKCRTLADALAKLISSRKTIVYVDFVRHVAPLTIALRECGTEAAGYHGKNLSTHDKKKILSRWRSNELQVVVSTKAFGMGINQPDVELVVRIGCPPSLEDWVQEFGRAGRDGRNAEGMCVLLNTFIVTYSYYHSTYFL